MTVLEGKSRGKEARPPCLEGDDQNLPFWWDSPISHFGISWSRKVAKSPNPAKMGHYSPNLVYQVHRISQTVYSRCTTIQSGVL